MDMFFSKSSDFEKKEEERRVLYVAITRAKDFLWMSYNKNYLGTCCSKADFLDEISAWKRSDRYF